MLYWMVAARRVTWNYALQRAAQLAQELNKPLLILEAVSCDYPWACDRFHRFLLEGMADNAIRIRRLGKAFYYPYVEPAKGAGKGLLATLAQHSCVVITDEYPAFIVPKLVDSLAPRLGTRLEQVDSNGVLPLRAAPEAYTTAHAFRRFLHRHVLEHLENKPLGDPLESLPVASFPALPREVTERWPLYDLEQLVGSAQALASLPINHGVEAVEERGGTEEAESRLATFLRYRLGHYAENHNIPEPRGTSELSPWLHFGHLSAMQVVDAVLQAEDWTPEKTGGGKPGKREGWWGLSPGAEAFLDQLVTWRELGFNLCWHQSDYDRYESLPLWARQTLAQHAADTRKYCYTLEQLETSSTQDPIWNAAQNQLRREGRIHNYLRMLWGKKVLEWTPNPQQALQALVELNNKWALDGRDPNSYSGIFWVLGRYDRAWGPERRIFGKIRYLSSENTARKLPLEDYMNRFGEPGWRSEQDGWADD